MKALLPALLFAWTLHAGAHPGGHGPGGDPIDQKDASMAAEQVVQLLVRDNKLAATWAQRQLMEAKLEQTSYGPIWIVGYRNPGEADANRRELFVVFDEAGNYLGASFTRPPTPSQGR